MRQGQRKVKEIVTHRKCRECAKFLPASRYFNCLECQPELPNIDEDFLYELGDGDMDDTWFEALLPNNKQESEKLAKLIEEDDAKLEDYEDELESYNTDEGTPH